MGYTTCATKIEKFSSKEYLSNDCKRLGCAAHDLNRGITCSVRDEAVLRRMS